MSGEGKTDELNVSVNLLLEWSDRVGKFTKIELMDVMSE